MSPYVHRTLNCSTVRRHIVLITRRRIHRHNLIDRGAHMPRNRDRHLTLYIPVKDEVVPVLIAFRPCRIIPEPILARIPNRAPDIAQTVIRPTDTSLAKAVLMQEESK